MIFNKINDNACLFVVLKNDVKIDLLDIGGITITLHPQLPEEYPGLTLNDGCRHISDIHANKTPLNGGAVLHNAWSVLNACFPSCYPY